jgi:hypothetical protein
VHTVFHTGSYWDCSARYLFRAILLLSLNYLHETAAHHSVQRIRRIEKKTCSCSLSQLTPFSLYGIGWVEPNLRSAGYSFYSPTTEYIIPLFSEALKKPTTAFFVLNSITFVHLLVLLYRIIKNFDCEECTVWWLEYYV